MYEDKIIKCVDAKVNGAECEGEFTFTAGEQEFYETKNFAPPRRCPPCRRKKRAHVNDQNG